MADAKDYLIFGDIDSRDYDIWLYRTNDIYKSPAREYRTIEIPGRSGDLLLDGRRFDNITVTYQALVPEDFDGTLKSNLADFRNALLGTVGYARLTDSFHPNEFRMAYYADGFSIRNISRLGDFGAFDVTFTCKPQRFLTSGEDITTIPIVNQEYTITNPTQFDSQPLIVMSPRPNSEAITSGNIVIGDVTLTMTNIPADVGLTIDCEMMSVYGTDGLNYNPNITLSGYDFPVFHPGNNTLTRYNVGVLEIQGRWFIL